MMNNLQKLSILAGVFSLFSAQIHAQDSGVFPSAEPSDAFIFQLKNSLVKVTNATKSGGHGYGTGVAIDKDHVVTNCHVIQNSSGISASKWGEAFAPVALQADWKHDVCILRFEWANFTPVPIGDSESLNYEQPVISISMPSDSPAPYVALGKVKALYAMDDAHVIRASAEFAIGASGSPVFDYSGNLIAISTVKSPGHRAYFYNMPAKWVKALLLTPEVKLNAPHDLPFWDAPDEQRPFFMRVVLPYQNAKWDELKVVADAWISKEPTSVEALFYAGVAAERLGDKNKANTYFQQVLKLQAQHSATLIELGLMAHRVGKADEVESTHVALKAIDADLDDEFTEALKLAATQ
jgi:serine protease Do